MLFERTRYEELRAKLMEILESRGDAEDDEIRAIIDSDERPKEYSKTVRFSLKPHKVHLFHRETEERLN